MTSEKRVMSAYAHQEPDRVPLDYSANVEIDAALKRYFGLPAEDGEGLCARLNTDFRGCWPRYTGPEQRQVLTGRRVSPWGVRTRWVEHSAGGYWDFCDFPLTGPLAAADVDAWPMPSPDDFDYAALSAYCEAHADFPIVIGGAGVGCAINRAGQLRSMPEALCDVATEDAAGLRLIDRIQAIDYEVAARALESVSGKAHIFCMGEDLGSQHGPIIRPDSFRRVLRPRAMKFIDLAKQHGLLIMFHCCGSSSWAFDDLADMGVDIIDALQPEARDMEPAMLKRRYGHKLAFHGGMSTSGSLSFGKPEDVREDVRRLLDIMMPGGGYAFAPAHMIQSNTPLENVLAMYEEALSYGQYA